MSTKRAPLSERRVAILASLMVIIGPISLSLYVPALPRLVEELATTPAAIKLSLTLYLLGFAFAQLICGPLSDRYGRRWVLLAFSIVYVAGAVFVLVSTSIEGLLIGRVVQGVGACAGVALSRAMVRDCFDGQTAARIMSTVAMLLSVAPALGPLLGSLLLRVADWHAIFAAMAAYGVGLVVLVLTVMPETNPRLDPRALHPVRMLTNYLRLLAAPTYMRMVVVMAVALGGLYTFASLTPFVYIDVIGLTPETFALVMVLGAAAFFAGSSVTNRMLRRTEASDLVVRGLVLVCLGAVGLAVGTELVTPSVVSVVLPTMCWSFGAALIMPGATMGALSPFPAMAGSAAALMGFLQMAAGVVGSAFGSLFTNNVHALAVTPFLMALTALAVFTLVRPRRIRLPAGR